LSDDRLNQMKREVRALVAQAGDHVNKFFAGGAIWWHEEPRVSSTAYPGAFEAPLRLALGALEPVLERYGYRDSNHRQASRRNPAGPIYPHNLLGIGWPPADVEALSKDYGRLHAEGAAAFAEIARIENEHAKAKAAKRWEDAG
jgi:hypothetical protein